MISGTDKAIKLLQKARALIARPGGWCKNFLEREGAYCAIGALNKAYNGRYYSEHLINFERFNIVNFNNARNTTQADVVALFDRAIRKLERGEAGDS